MANDAPNFSRTPTQSPFGKCTEDLKCKVPYDVKSEFTKMTHELGFTDSELLCDMVMIRLYGVDRLVSLNAQRLSVVAGIGQEKAIQP